MAASYSTGIPSSPTDLVQKLVTWLVSQGWTNNMSQADGTGWRAHLSKGGNYINLRATPGSETIWGFGINNPGATQLGIGLYLGTGFSAGSDWKSQAGGPIGSGQTYTVGPFVRLPAGACVAHHFFDDGADNIVVVIEKTSGVFTHFGWGNIVKAGTITGGAFFFGPISAFFGGISSGAGVDLTAFTPCCHGDLASANGTVAAWVRADVDAFTGKWVGICTGTQPAYGYTGKLGASSVFSAATLPVDIPQYTTAFQNRQVSAMNSQANLLPVRVFAQRDAGGYSLLGDIPNIFFSNGVGNGFAPSSIYPLGSDNYMIFPNFAVLKKA